MTLFIGCYLWQLPQELGINIALVTLTFLKASFKDKRYVENELQWSATRQLLIKATHTTSVSPVGWSPEAHNWKDLLCHTDDNTITSLFPVNYYTDVCVYQSRVCSNSRNRSGAAWKVENVNVKTWFH